MKAGELAVALGVSRDTLYAWVKRPELARYFSSGAVGEGGSAHRVFSENDVAILSTINHLRYTEKVTDWEAIAAYLDSGQRFTEFPQNAISADPRTIPIQQAEQSAKAMATLAERDAALLRVRELEGEIERLRSELEKQRERSDNKIEALLREIAELRYQMGKMERDKGE